MTYSESSIGIIITAARAKLELKRHGLERAWSAFIADMGVHETYDASAVLHWLGY